MKALHLHSFIHSFILVLFLRGNLVTALPTTNRPESHQSSAVPTSTRSNNDNTQTIKTTQVFTVSGGNTTETCILTKIPTTTTNGDAAIILTKACSFNFTPSSIHAPTVMSAPMPHSMGPSSTARTAISSTAPTSAGAVLLSIFTTDALPMSTGGVSRDTKSLDPTPTTSKIVPQATAIAPDVLNQPGTSTTTSDSTPLPSPPSTSSTSPADPFTATAENHLSSLPIFVGSFIGIACLALLVVGFKVYRPVQKFNEMRLHPPSVLSYLKSRFSAEHDTEKFSGRTSRETQIQNRQTDSSHQDIW